MTSCMFVVRKLPAVPEVQKCISSFHETRRASAGGEKRRCKCKKAPERLETQFEFVHFRLHKWMRFIQPIPHEYARPALDEAVSSSYTSYQRGGCDREREN